MKIYSLLFIGLIAFLTAMYVVLHKTNILPQKPETVVFNINEKPLSCVFERKTVVDVKADAKEVKNATDLKAYDMSFENEESAYFIVSAEEPFKVGQTFLVATNCEPVDEKSQVYVDNVQTPCSGIYVYNKALFQLQRECGIVVGEKALFLKSPKKTF